MRIRARAFALAAAALAASAPSAAEPTAPEQGAAGRYAVRVHVSMTAAAVAATYFPGGAGGGPMVLGSSPVEVGSQARDAYESVARRMFDTDQDRPVAELAPTVASYGVDLGGEGWFAYVEHDLVLRELAGAEIARWRVRGEGRISGLGPNATRRAFEEATGYAARTFEADFERAPGVIAWLAGRGIPPRAGAAATSELTRRFAPEPVPVVAPRSGDLVYAELGAFGVSSAGGRVGAGPSIRAGRSVHAWLFQMALDTWRVEFLAHPEVAWGDARASAYVLSTGLDVGLQHRVGPRLELAAGVGAALVTASGSARYVPLVDPTSTQRASELAFAAVASAFGAARLNAVVPGLGFRYRVGLEVRQRAGTRLRFGDLGRTLETGGTSAGVVLGFELPR